jgi:Protein of unknown function (DUF2499)/Protein of unknown function (DUF3593)
MFVDPWSVSQSALDMAAGQLFTVSLFPYLAFLYFLSKDETEVPAQALFGFKFLLAFVFLTIPAGIYAKVHYHDILANIDWLHGSAESLLTITNLLIVVGFRDALAKLSTQGKEANLLKPPTTRVNSTLLSSAAALGLYASSLAIGFVHPEPENALSFPTWIIHVSSLVEWLVAMGLVWQYADVSGNRRWKGLTWGMLPLHTSGICACTYHLFYNAPSLNLLVTLQAGLTCLGNATMAFAAYRIYQYGKSTRRASSPTVGAAQESHDTRFVTEKSSAFSGFIGFEDLGDALRKDSNTGFVLKLFILSAIGSGIVKWGSLAVDGVFNPDPNAALALVFVPSFLNMAKWAVRSRKPDSNFGDLF